MTSGVVRNGRGRLEWSAAVAAFVIASSAASSQDFPNGAAAGDVDQSSIVLWARVAAAGSVTFDYGVDPAFAVIEGSVVVEVADPAVPAKAAIDGLFEGTRYFYRATGPAGEVRTGSFQTPVWEGFDGLRFGVSGDWRGELRPYVSVANLPSRDLDFFVALGDTIYADDPSIDFPGAQARSVDDFRVKHNEVYSERFGLNTLADVRSSTAFLVNIDDHEVTNDFAGGAAPESDDRFDQTGEFINETELFRNGLDVFHEYNPIREEFYGETGDPRTAGKRKLYRFRTFGQDAALVMLDARSFRDEPLEDLLSIPTRREHLDFLERSFDPARTMLGRAQLDDLLADLTMAEEMGITWKFVLVPEPIQNLGPILASDRFEGYAFERSEILGFIDRACIRNVVFIAADIHGTVVNDLVYQRSPRGRPLRVDAFEITTGAVAYAPPFGQAIIDYAPPRLAERYVSLDRVGQNLLIERLGNLLALLFDFPRLGLGEFRLPATLLEGSYVAVNSYGWTEFEIDADTQALTVTTYGVDWYSPEDVEADPDSVLALAPQVVSRFEVEARGDGRSRSAAQGLTGRPLTGPAVCGALDGSAACLVPLALAGACGGRKRRRGERTTECPST